MQLAIVPKNWLVTRYFNSYRKGILAEFLVKLWLLCKGYKIIEQRFKTKLGEIDLICQKGQVIIFIEVKYRKEQAQFFALINQKQQIRIINASKIWLQKQNLTNLQLRYDVFFVNFPKYFRHIKNAF